MFVLKIFENNKMKYFFTLGSSLPAWKQGHCQFFLCHTNCILDKNFLLRGIAGHNIRELMCLEFNIMICVSHNLLLPNMND